MEFQLWLNKCLSKSIVHRVRELRNPEGVGLHGNVPHGTSQEQCPMGVSDRHFQGALNHLVLTFIRMMVTLPPGSSVEIRLHQKMVQFSLAYKYVL